MADRSACALGRGVLTPGDWGTPQQGKPNLGKKEYGTYPRSKEEHLVMWDLAPVKKDRLGNLGRRSGSGVRRHPRSGYNIWEIRDLQGLSEHTGGFRETLVVRAHTWGVGEMLHIRVDNPSY